MNDIIILGTGDRLSIVTTTGDAKAVFVHAQKPGFAGVTGFLNFHE